MPLQLWLKMRYTFGGSFNAPILFIPLERTSLDLEMAKDKASCNAHRLWGLRYLEISNPPLFFFSGF